jgi:hypothetical protein
MSSLRIGCVVGLLFGSWNVLYSWLFPLAEDTALALLAFYGPMFLVWGFESFLAVRRSRRVLHGVATGALVAFATFCVYNLLVVLRVNLMLEDLTGRADWQNLLVRYRESGFESLRIFVNVENIKGAPFKIGVATAIGAVVGVVGGAIGRLGHGRQPAASS